jgi:hypothetical protein
MPVSLSIVVHAHQPVGNFDHVIEDAYQTSYLPFVREAAEFEDLRFTIHFSGYLLEWITARHPEYIALLRRLIDSGRLEVLGGGYYEPILIAIRDRDKQQQIARLRELVAKILGRQPSGIWLTERVWEPELPALLAAAGVRYAVVDDTHFLMTGLEPEQTYGYFETEHDGRAVALVPSNRTLRLQIPFRPEDEALSTIRMVASEHEDALLTMGDDLEKFGTWPQTFEHVYKDGWLRRFFTALTESPELVRTVTLGEYIQAHPPLGIAYLPVASYAEMMQWALPPKAAAEFERAQHDEAVEPYRRFLAGAPWRCFLARYREANYLHKSVLELSRRYEEYFQRARHSISPGAMPGAAPAAQLEARGGEDPGRAAEAAYERGYGHLLAAECNDAYWHGLFGGLYAPHLRDSVFTEFLKADTALGELAGVKPIRSIDLNLDGTEEVEIRNRWLRLVLAPNDGATAEEIDFLPASANLVNSLQRRPEVYHAKIRSRVTKTVQDFPSQQMDSAKEHGLERLLQYDRYARTCFRLYVFSGRKQYSDFVDLALDEWPELAAGRFDPAATVPNDAKGVGDWASILQRALTGTSTLRMVRKGFALEDAESEGRIRHHVWLTERLPPDTNVGIEMVLNFLAPAAEDRRLIHGTGEFPLSWSGELSGGALDLTDGWKNLRVRLSAEGADHWWVQPIYTVSQSEGGFERVYQGSAILAVWRQPGREFSMTLAARRLRP